MSDDLRERVARAIANVREGGWPADTYALLQQHYLTMADAALAEMGGVRVKPLIWYGKPNDQDIRIGRCGQVSYSVGFKMGQWGYQRRGDTGHTVSYKGGPIFACEADAIDGADIDHEARILAALE